MVPDIWGSVSLAHVCTLCACEHSSDDKLNALKCLHCLLTIQSKPGMAGGYYS